jgi:hypothetical protein
MIQGLRPEMKIFLTERLVMKVENQTAANVVFGSLVGEVDRRIQPPVLEHDGLTQLALPKEALQSYYHNMFDYL